MSEERETETAWNSARILSEALPFIQLYAGRTIVVKFGGHAMGSRELTDRFAADVVLLKQVGINPVIVHGGGSQIGRMLKRLGIESEFVDGLRVSGPETVAIAEMVLSGAINKSLVQALNKAGGRGVGLSGKDAGLITARALRDDLGFTGCPETTDTALLDVLASSDPGFIPVISPISGGTNGESYNVNADTAAGAIASALGAVRLMLLTDVEGILDDDGRLLTRLAADEAKKLVASGTARGGMIPKIETAVDAVNRGVGSVVILDGRRAHGLLVELFTGQGAGTLIQ